MRARLDARPYLVALAGAANAGSAATLIGNPQNILIGQAGGLAFWPYLLVALPPTLLSLAFVYRRGRLDMADSLAAANAAPRRTPSSRRSTASRRSRRFVAVPR